VIPKASIAGGATAPRGGTGGMSPVDFIRAMGRAGARLDAYAHHPHPLSPAETPLTGGCAHCATRTPPRRDANRVRTADEDLADRARVPDEPTRPHPRRLMGTPGSLRRRGATPSLRREPRRPADPVSRTRRAEPRSVAERLRDDLGPREARADVVLAAARPGVAPRPRHHAVGSGPPGSWVTTLCPPATPGWPLERSRLGLPHDRARILHADGARRQGSAAPAVRPAVEAREPDARRHVAPVADNAKAVV
jgi:hypothetical protein